ncbi:MAG: FMN-binding protein, partial [Clostridiales bacterium]|nr:FMN-binding protein [Clostridiales bacterium]
MNKKNFKKILCIMLCLILSLSAVACQSTPEETDVASMFKAGTYIGVANGHNGEIKVEVTVDEESIKEIKVLEHNESPGISDPAIERIPQAIVDSQSLAVDAISGATVTSDAIILAITNALKEAGADIDALMAKKDAEEGERETIEETTDVVVIGGGGAGLAAAVSAHQNGAEVILVEKMPRL